jgi:23S rRNA (uridine2552-2'-O)-methyltransferase
MSKPRRSGGSWRQRQEKDPFVQMARKEGWRSRAVFKLKEILDKERLLRPGMVCIDLGAAPGGWSQYIAETLDGRARIIALDLLPMDTLPGVEFLQGDFTEDEVLEALEQALGDDRADLVMSDMAPNISGNKVVDQPRAMYLAELAFDLAKRTLKPDGSFICKLFQGEGTEALIAEARRAFGKVKIVKPKASRASSSEIYLVARNYQVV